MALGYAYDQFWRPAGDPGGYWGRGSISQLVDNPAYALFGWRGPLRTGDERPKNAVVAQRIFHPGSAVPAAAALVDSSMVTEPVAPSSVLTVVLIALVAWAVLS